jgi:hypothetical protein
LKSVPDKIGSDSLPAPWSIGQVQPNRIATGFFIDDAGTLVLFRERLMTIRAYHSRRFVLRSYASHAAYVSATEVKRLQNRFKNSCFL